MSYTGAVLTGSDWKNIDKKIQDYLTAPLVALKLFDTTRIPAGKMVQEFYEWEELEGALFTYSLEEQNLLKLTKKVNLQRLIGMRVDFEMGKVETDAMRSSGLSYESDVLRLGSQRMSQFIDRAVFLGTSARDMRGSMALTIEGMYNKTGVQTIEAGAGLDDDITAVGDGPDTVLRAINQLVAQNHYGPYDLVISPGVWSQLIKNRNATSDRTDMSLIMDFPRIDSDGNTLKEAAIRSIRVTKELYAGDEANSYGQLMLCETKKENMEVLINYDIQRLNLFNGGLNPRLAYQFCLIAGMAANVKRPNAIVVAKDLTLDVFAA
jgi:uncharacterized linocin/CFP29 family protein